MSQSLGPQFSRVYKPITESEARGNSRGVDALEFQQLARAGHKYMEATKGKQGSSGIDTNWDEIKQRAHEITREPWGGATITSHTGHFIGDTADDVAAKSAQAQGKGFGTDRYAVTNRHPGQPQISIPADAPQHHFNAAMDQAKASYPQIANRGGHLGVFHDADKGTIDIDPVQVVRTPDEVEKVGAYTHAVGGAYHFASGNGYFPPHVKGS